MKRFLYLDCDGILNGSSHKIDDFMVYKHPKGSIMYGDPFNIYKVAMLAKLVVMHNIEVIGISSWFGGSDEQKVLQTLRDCEDFLLPIHRTSSCTSGGIGRCEAILDDVMEKQPEFWCILDDGERNYYRTNHPFYDKQPYFDVRGKLVSPSGRYGINEEHIEQIAMLLNITNLRYTVAQPLGWVQDKITYDANLGGTETVTLEIAEMLQRKRV